MNGGIVEELNHDGLQIQMSSGSLIAHICRCVSEWISPSSRKRRIMQEKVSDKEDDDEDGDSSGGLGFLDMYSERMAGGMRAWKSSPTEAVMTVLSACPSYRSRHELEAALKALIQSLLSSARLVTLSLFRVA